MKELSRQSLRVIKNIIQEENYTNLKARIDQYLPQEEANVFAKVAFSGDVGIWFGVEGVNYNSFADATDTEKEEIAITLEAIKESVRNKLRDVIPSVDKLFTIPSTNEIFWYRDSSGLLKVTLAQWGFRSNSSGSPVDVIDVLIGSPRTLSQCDVVIHFSYSDGQRAVNMPFILGIFGSKKNCETNQAGDFVLGKIFIHKKFTVEDDTGAQCHEFTVEQGKTYFVTFDRYTKYSVEIKNQFGEKKPDFKFLIDRSEVSTDSDGAFVSEDTLLTSGKRVKVSLLSGASECVFVLSPDEDDNHFVYTVIDEIRVPPPPVRKVSFRLLDKDGTPMPDLPFQIISKDGKVIDCRTDSSGVAQVPEVKFAAQADYKVSFVITPEYQERLNHIRNQKQ